MGRALQGFSQEQGKGGGQLSAVEAPAPRQVSGPLGLGPGYPGAQVGHCWWEPALGSWRVSHVRACVTALMPPVRLFVPPGFPGRAWESSRLDTRPWGRLALWPVPRGVCSPGEEGSRPPTSAPWPPHLWHSPCPCSPLYRCSCGTRCWPGSSRGPHRGWRSRGRSLRGGGQP